MNLKKIILRGYMPSFSVGQRYDIGGEVGFIIAIDFVVKGNAHETVLTVSDVSWYSVGDQPTENGGQATPVPGNMLRDNGEWNY